MSNLPILPKNRVINTTQHKTISFLGFKLTKVKHMFFLVCYLVSMVLALLVMIDTQNGEGLASRYIIFNVFFILIRLATMFVCYLYKNWNRPIN